MARNVALIFLTVTLGLFYVFSGTIKLSPVISADAFRTMRTEFKSYTKVFPLNGLGGLKLKPSVYRKSVGTLEVLSGLILILIPGRLKQLANVVLLTLMLGAVYTHWALGSDFQHVSGALIFSLLLTCRLAIDLQQAAGRRAAAAVAAEQSAPPAADSAESEETKKEQ